MSGKYLAVCLKIAIFPSERCGPALPGALGEVFGLTLAQFWKILEICPVLYLASSTSAALLKHWRLATTEIRNADSPNFNWNTEPEEESI